MSKYKIMDLEVEYEVIHRNIKYPRLEVKTGYLYLILPKEYHNHQELLKKHENWIYNKISLIKNSQKEALTRSLNHDRTEKKFKSMVLLYVDKISQELNVTVNQIRFQRMKSQWGSCSSQGNINFNLYLKYLPSNLIEYIVYHELAHLIEMGHNKKFWNLISNRFNDYNEKENELLIYYMILAKEHPFFDKKILK
jgi:predicted metal-dependent hydrolase